MEDYGRFGAVGRQRTREGVARQQKLVSSKGLRRSLAPEPLNRTGHSGPPCCNLDRERQRAGLLTIDDHLHDLAARLREDFVYSHGEVIGLHPDLVRTAPGWNSGYG